MYVISKMSSVICSYNEAFSVTDIYVSEFSDVSDYRFLRLSCFVDSPLRVALEWSIDGRQPLLGTNLLSEAYLVPMNEWHSECNIHVKMSFVRVRFTLVDRDVFPFTRFHFQLEGPRYTKMSPPNYNPPIPPPLTSAGSEKHQEGKISKMFKRSKSESSFDTRFPCLLLKNQMLIVEGTNRVGVIPPPIGQGIYYLTFENGKVQWASPPI
jgi:hypothetical protein